MAGAHIQVELDTQKVLQVLQQAAAALDSDGMRLLLDDMGDYLVEATRDRAAREASPSGTPWPALSPRYARRKQRKHPGAHMLVFDDHMLGDRLTHQIEGDTLYVGTSAKYGAIQQFGGRGIPPRPWLGVSDADAQELVQIVQDHLRAALDG